MRLVLLILLWLKENTHSIAVFNPVILETNNRKFILYPTEDLPIRSMTDDASIRKFEPLGINEAETIREPMDNLPSSGNINKELIESAALNILNGRGIGRKRNRIQEAPEAKDTIHPLQETEKINYSERRRTQPAPSLSVRRSSRKYEKNNYEVCGWGEWGSYGTCTEMSVGVCKIVRVRHASNKDDCGSYNIQVTECECNQANSRLQLPEEKEVKMDVMLCYVNRNEIKRPRRKGDGVPYAERCKEGALGEGHAGLNEPKNYDKEDYDTNRIFDGGFAKKPDVHPEDLEGQEPSVPEIAPPAPPPTTPELDEAPPKKDGEDVMGPEQPPEDKDAGVEPEVFEDAGGHGQKLKEKEDEADEEPSPLHRNRTVRALSAQIIHEDPSKSKIKEPEEEEPADDEDVENPPLPEESNVDPMDLDQLFGTDGYNEEEQYHDAEGGGKDSNTEVEAKTGNDSNNEEEPEEGVEEHNYEEEEEAEEEENNYEDEKADSNQGEDGLGAVHENSDSNERKI